MAPFSTPPALSPRYTMRDTPRPETPSRGLYSTNEEDLPDILKADYQPAQDFDFLHFSRPLPLPPASSYANSSATTGNGEQRGSRRLNPIEWTSAIPRRQAVPASQRQQSSEGQTYDDLLEFNATHGYQLNSPARDVLGVPQRPKVCSVAPRDLLAHPNNESLLAAEIAHVDRRDRHLRLPQHWDPEPPQDSFDWTEIDNNLRRCGLPPRGCLIREEPVTGWSPREPLDWNSLGASQVAPGACGTQQPREASRKKRRVDSALKSWQLSRSGPRARNAEATDRAYKNYPSPTFSAINIHPYRKPRTVVERRASRSWKAKELAIFKRQVQPTGDPAEYGSPSHTYARPTEPPPHNCDSINSHSCSQPPFNLPTSDYVTGVATSWKINYDGNLCLDRMDPFEGSDDSSLPEDSRLGDRPHTAYAKLLFPDCTYYLRELSLTIGRGSRKDQFPTSTSAQVRTTGSNDDYLSQEFGNASPPPTGRDGPENANNEDMFKGGIGGPQDQPPRKSHLRDPCRIDVYPRIDNEGNEIARKTLSRNHLRFYWNFAHRAWILEVLGRNGVGLDGSFAPPKSSIMLGDVAKIDLGSYEIYWHDSGVIQAGDDTPDDSFDDSSTDVDFDIDEQYDVEERITNDQSFLLKNQKLGDDALPVPESEEEEEEEESEVEEQRAQSQPAPKPKQKIRLSIRPSQSNMRGGITAKKSGARGRAQEPGEVTPNVKKEKGKRKRTPDDDDEDEDQQDEADTPQQSVEDKPTKRGPGRPPKDGQMSKKERRDRAKAQQLGLEYGVDEIPRKNNYRSRKKKDDEPEEAEAEEVEPAESQPKKEKEKKKGKARVSKSTADDDEEEEKEEPADSKEPLPPFRKSPPNSFAPQPCPNKEDMTEEQLREPGLTYAVMVCEVLKASEEPLTLQEIYEHFKRKWPHFHFKDTNGWQSSIRHNLSPENGLKVMGKAGKGKYWAIDENAVVKQKPSKKKDPKPTMGPMPVSMGRPAFPGQPGSGYPYGYPGSGGQHIAPGMPPQSYGQGQAGPSMPQPNGVPGPFPQSQQQQRPNGYMPQQQGPMTAAQGAQRPAAMNTGATNGPPGPASAQPGAAQQVRPPMSTPQGSARPPQPNGAASSTAIPRAPNATSGQAANPATRAVQTSRSRQSSAGPNQANAPANPNAPMSEAELRSRKRRVFENFRGSLVNLAPTQDTRDRYNRLMNVAINFVISHPAHVHYTAPGPDQRDINNIIRMLWGTWDTHYLNPNRQEAPTESRVNGPTSSAQNGAQPSATTVASASGNSGGTRSTANGANTSSVANTSAATNATTASSPTSTNASTTAWANAPTAPPRSATSDAPSAASATPAPSATASTSTPPNPDSAARTPVRQHPATTGQTMSAPNNDQASTATEASATNGTSPSSVGSSNNAASSGGGTAGSSSETSADLSPSRPETKPEANASQD